MKHMTRHPHRTQGLARLALGLVILGSLTGAGAALGGPAFAYPPRLPKITTTAATFNIPTGNGKGSVFTLELWSHGTLEGSVQGTSGMLTVAVLPTAACTVQADVYLELQADVYLGAPGSHGNYYSGIRVSLRDCAPTIAGDIDLCSSTGAQTTTEIAGGTLTATGPESLAPRPNPLTPVRVPSGTYTMTAGAPPGYVLVACGGGSTVASTGDSASEPVAVSSGDGTGTGVGVGVFYATAATSPVGVGGGGGGGSTGAGSAGGGSTGAGSAGGGAGGIASQTSAATSKAPSVAAGSASRDAGSAPLAATAAGSSALAFTGMNVGPTLLLGLVLLLLGMLATATSRLRRRATMAPSKVSGRGA
jgi:hypothetical protein